MNKDIRILDIYLDSDNPRHEKITDQPEIIKYLLSDERVKDLAKDIAENGLSPIDLIAVIKDGKNRYVVAEGNRRACALTLLNDPSKAPTKNLVEYFGKLKNQSTRIPDVVNCIIFSTQDEADIWIERRHSGEQNGVGVRQWDAKQKTRFNTTRSKRDDNALAQAILEYSIKYDLVSINNISGILTTASRFLGNPFFRKTLGISSSRSDINVQITVPFGFVAQRFII